MSVLIFKLIIFRRLKQDLKQTDSSASYSRHVRLRQSYAEAEKYWENQIYSQIIISQ